MLQTSPSLKPIPTPGCEIISAESGCTSEDDASPSIHPRLPQALAIRVLREVLSCVCSGTSRRGAGTDPALARPGFGRQMGKGRWGRCRAGSGSLCLPTAGRGSGAAEVQGRRKKKKKRGKSTHKLIIGSSVKEGWQHFSPLKISSPTYTKIQHHDLFYTDKNNIQPLGHCCNLRHTCPSVSRRDELLKTLLLMLFHIWQANN